MKRAIRGTLSLCACADARDNALLSFTLAINDSPGMPRVTLTSQIRQSHPIHHSPPLRDVV